LRRWRAVPGLLVAASLLAASIAGWRVYHFADASGVGMTSRPPLGAVPPFASSAQPSPEAVVATRFPPTGVAGQIERGERINILLLGYGGVGHDGAFLTDSMLVASLNPTTKQATMISVPRDTWVKIPTNGREGAYWKINAAFALGLEDASFPRKDPAFRGPDGGAHLAVYVVQQVLGIPIHYWIALDFNAFRAGVDSVGGVDLTVDRTFTARYPANDNPDIDSGWTTVHFDAGPQHMAGERALEYARARYSETAGEGTDFARARRQQRLLEAIKRQVFSVGGLLKVLPLMDALEGHVRTNLGLTDLPALATLLEHTEEAPAGRVIVDDTDFLLDAWSADGQAILVPRAGTWDVLHAHLAQLLGSLPRDDELHMTYAAWVS